MTKQPGRIDLFSELRRIEHILAKIRNAQKSAPEPQPPDVLLTLEERFASWNGFFVWLEGALERRAEERRREGDLEEADGLRRLSRLIGPLVPYIDC
jgi:hypothetical protein